MADVVAASECPCLTQLSQEVKSALMGLGYPSGYGEGECKQHDDKLAVSNCAVSSEARDRPSYCTRPWCVLSVTVWVCMYTCVFVYVAVNLFREGWRVN